MAFVLVQVEGALAHFFRGNTFFTKCHLTEMTFDSPADFPLSSFQGVLAEKFADYYDSFLIASVTFRSDPHTQGVFTCVPFPLLDGYKCFTFHQTLMKTLKSGRDEFQIAKGLTDLGIRPDDLVDLVPPAQASSGGEVNKLPVRFTQTVDPRTRIGPYLDKMKAKFLDRSSENMFILKNALYSPDLPLGNSLLFLTVPRDVVAQGTGIQIRDYYHGEEQKQMAHLFRIEQRDDFIEAGRARIGAMIATPDVFCVNNYGDVTALDGSDSHADRALLTKYEWHVPIIVLGLAAGERSGFSFTITIRDKAFNCDTVALSSPPVDINEGALAPSQTGSLA